MDRLSQPIEGPSAIGKLIAIYERGSITAYEAMIDCLHRLDPDDPDLILAELPAAILDEMRTYARRYDPDCRAVGPRPLPAGDQVRAAERWISSRPALSPRHVGQ